jgi:lactaldehyde dehydrogenase/glycolaldehyde dehydrogenase
MSLGDVGGRRQLFLGGRWLDAGDGGTRAVINPATGEAFAAVPEATRADAQEALAAAAAAQPSWEARPPIERAAYLHRIAALVREHKEELARLVTMEEGKPIGEARGEVDLTAEFFTYFAEFARRIEGDLLPSDNHDEHVLILRVPYGVVAAIIPWNYPSALCARKVAPALIAGNTVVLKPHEDTPLSALALAELIEQAELPPGVINIVTGAGESVGEALVSDPNTALVTLTGSVPVGKRILELAAHRVLPVSLELGGKAPFIVLADADLDAAVRGAITSRFMNCGQVCICNERTLVQRHIFDEFVNRYIEAAARLRVGDPLDPATEVGPKVSQTELERVEQMVAAAQAEGARVMLGGTRLEGPQYARGYWYAPTVLTEVRPEMEVLQREVFGPVASIMPFDEFEEAIAIANDSRYGLSAYLFTNDLRRAMAAMRAIRFGELYINRAGGEQLQGYHTGYRESGLGGDDGKYGLDGYLRRKTVYLNYAAAPSATHSLSTRQPR